MASLLYVSFHDLYALYGFCDSLNFPGFSMTYKPVGNA
jgi:hypothetical protein